MAHHCYSVYSDLTMGRLRDIFPFPTNTGWFSVSGLGAGYSGRRALHMQGPLQSTQDKNRSEINPGATAGTGIRRQGRISGQSSWRAAAKPSSPSRACAEGSLPLRTQKVPLTAQHSHSTAPGAEGVLQGARRGRR